MKLFISADMEGVAGVTAWEDVEIGSKTYNTFREQMTREVLAVCNTILDEAKARETEASILIKDGHSTARNLQTESLPNKVKLFSGWARDPYVMMSGLDSSFDAVIFTGYHSGATYAGNPLSHTMNHEKIIYFKINDSPVSEFIINAYTAAYLKVPVIAIIGDELVCQQAKEFIPSIVTIPVKKGIGGGIISLSNKEALELIESGIKKALSIDTQLCLPKLPSSFRCEICFHDHQLAYRASFYKGVNLINDHTISFETDDYFEVLRTYFFL